MVNSKKNDKNTLDNRGLIFRFTDKVYPLKLSNKYLPPQINTMLIVSTSRGVECGKVVLMSAYKNNKNAKKDLNIYKILRIATTKDLSKYNDLFSEEEKISKICIKKIAEYQVPMKLIRTDLTFDRNRVFFHYKQIEIKQKKRNRATLEELIRDLSKTLKVKVDFNQVGDRGSAKISGGMGSCGKKLCCATWLNKNKQISIKMAKSQGLGINMQKLSGLCGRLHCCLQYEMDNYNKGKLIDSENKTQEVEKFLDLFTEEN